jgi:hypothetical protein
MGERQEGLGHQRGLERRQRGRPGKRHNNDDRGRQRAAQDRRPTGRGEDRGRPGAAVSIANFAFAPTPLALAAGTTVT